MEQFPMWVWVPDLDKIGNSNSKFESLKDIDTDETNMKYTDLIYPAVCYYVVQKNTWPLFYDLLKTLSSLVPVLKTKPGKGEGEKYFTEDVQASFCQLFGLCINNEGDMIDEPFFSA
jgi:hypothetical protein